VVGILVTIAAIWAYFYKPAIPVSLPPSLPAATKDTPVTPIVDGAAIDFSTGKPVVSTSAADKASMDAAVKQIDEAAKGVTFKADPTPTK
jgi:hypothetical protein